MDELCEPGAVPVRISVPLTLILNPVGLMFIVLVKVKLPDALVPAEALVPPDGPVLVVVVIFVSVNPPLQAEAPAGGVTVQVRLVGKATLGAAVQVVE